MWESFVGSQILLCNTKTDFWVDLIEDKHDDMKENLHQSEMVFVLDCWCEANIYSWYWNDFFFVPLQNWKGLGFCDDILSNSYSPIPYAIQKCNAWSTYQVQELTPKD